MNDFNPFLPQKKGNNKSTPLGFGLDFGLNSNNKEKIKRRTIDKNIRHKVWQIYNKNSLSGKCYACKTPITFQHFHVGHNKAIAKEGKDDISNLRPICNSCNSSMGTMSIEKYKNKYFKSLHKNNIKKIKPKIKKTQKQKGNNNLLFENMLGLPKKSSKNNNPFGFKF